MSFNEFIFKTKRFQKFYYRKRGSASYIVREVRSVRERERDTERDGSDVTIVALKRDGTRTLGRLCPAIGREGVALKRDALLLCVRCAR